MVAWWFSKKELIILHFGLIWNTSKVITGMWTLRNLCEGLGISSFTKTQKFSHERPWHSWNAKSMDLMPSNHCYNPIKAMRFSAMFNFQLEVVNIAGAPHYRNGSCRYIGHYHQYMYCCICSTIQIYSPFIPFIMSPFFINVNPVNNFRSCTVENFSRTLISILYVHKYVGNVG